MHPNRSFSGDAQRTGTAGHTTASRSVWTQASRYTFVYLSEATPGSGSEWTGQNAFEGYHYHKNHEGWRCVFYKLYSGSELKSAQTLEGTACFNVSLGFPLDKEKEIVRRECNFKTFPLYSILRKQGTERNLSQKCWFLVKLFD